MTRPEPDGKFYGKDARQKNGVWCIGWDGSIGFHRNHDRSEYIEGGWMMELRGKAHCNRESELTMGKTQTLCGEKTRGWYQPNHGKKNY